MYAFEKLVYDDVILGASAVQYSDARLEPVLGAVEQVGYMVIATILTGPATLTIDLESSNDGRNWTARIPGFPFMSATLLTAGIANVFYLPDDGSRIMGARTRLKLSLSAGGGTVLIKIYACGRTRRANRNRGPQAMEEACCGGCADNVAATDNTPRGPLVAPGPDPNCGISSVCPQAAPGSTACANCWYGLSCMAHAYATQCAQEPKAENKKACYASASKAVADRITWCIEGGCGGGPCELSDCDKKRYECIVDPTKKPITCYLEYLQCRGLLEHLGMG